MTGTFNSTWMLFFFFLLSFFLKTLLKMNLKFPRNSDVYLDRKAIACNHMFNVGDWNSLKLNWEARNGATSNWNRDNLSFQIKKEREKEAICSRNGPEFQWILDGSDRWFSILQLSDLVYLHSPQLKRVNAQTINNPQRHRFSSSLTSLTRRKKKKIEPRKKTMNSNNMALFYYSLELRICKRFIRAFHSNDA